MIDDPIAERVLNGTHEQVNWTKKDSAYLVVKIAGFLISVKYLYQDWNTDVSMWYVLLEMLAVTLFFGMLLMSSWIVKLRIDMERK